MTIVIYRNLNPVLCQNSQLSIWNQRCEMFKHYFLTEHARALIDHDENILQILIYSEITKQHCYSNFCVLYDIPMPGRARDLRQIRFKHEKSSSQNRARRARFTNGIISLLLWPSASPLPPYYLNYFDVFYMPYCTFVSFPVVLLQQVLGTYYSEMQVLLQT